MRMSAKDTKPLVHHTALKPGSNACVALAFDTGALVESTDAGERGLAHVVEHMVFKRTTCMDEGDVGSVSTERGARFNAWTGFDIVTFFFECDPRDLRLFARVLIDMCFHAKFNDAHLSRELLAVLDEMNRRENTAGAQVWRAVRKLAGVGQIADHDPIGTVDDLLALNASKLQAFLQRHFRPDRCAWVVASPSDGTQGMAEFLQQLIKEVKLPQSAAPPSARDVIQQHPLKLPSGECVIRTFQSPMVKAPHVVAAWILHDLNAAERQALDYACMLARACLLRGKPNQTLSNAGFTRVSLSLDSVIPGWCMLLLSADCVDEPANTDRRALAGRLKTVMRGDARAQALSELEARHASAEWLVSVWSRRRALMRSPTSVVQMIASGVLDHAHNPTEHPQPDPLKEPSLEECSALARRILEGMGDVRQVTVAVPSGPLHMTRVRAVRDKFDSVMEGARRASKAAVSEPKAQPGDECSWLMERGDPQVPDLPTASADSGEVHVRVLSARGWSMWHNPQAWGFELLAQLIMNTCDLSRELAKHEAVLGLERTGTLVLSAKTEAGLRASEGVLLGAADSCDHAAFSAAKDSLRASEAVFQETSSGVSMQKAVLCAWGKDVTFDSVRFLDNLSMASARTMWRSVIHAYLGSCDNLAPVPHPPLAPAPLRLPVCVPCTGGVGGSVCMVVELGFSAERELDLVCAAAAQVALFGGVNSLLFQLREKEGLFYGITGTGTGSVALSPPKGTPCVCMVQAACQSGGVSLCASRMLEITEGHTFKSDELRGHVRQGMARDLKDALLSEEKRAVIKSQLAAGGWSFDNFMTTFRAVMDGSQSLPDVRVRVHTVVTASPHSGVAPSVCAMM